MNYLDAKEEVLDKLAPRVGERYIIGPEVLGVTVYVEIDKVSDGMIWYTVVKCLNKAKWAAPLPAKVEIRITSWWQAQNDGYIYEEPDPRPRRRIRRVQGVRP